MPTTSAQFHQPWGGCFDRTRLESPATFYLRELSLSRFPRRPNAKGWVSGLRSPLRSSRSGKSFSINVIHGGFYDFGSGARGDMVDFIRLRYGCDFKTAANKLGAWRGVTLTREGWLQLAKAAAEVERRRADREESEQQAKEAERERRLALREEIYTTANIYREASDRLSALRQGASPAYEDEEQHCWGILSLALEDLRLTEAEYMDASGFQEMRGCE